MSCHSTRNEGRAEVSREVAGWRDRRDDDGENAGAFDLPLADRFDELIAAQRLVGHDENVGHHTPS